MTRVRAGVRWSTLPLILAAVTVSLALASPAVAQEDPIEPPVTLDVHAFPDRPVPLGAPVQTALSATVGCDAMETPESTTTVTVETPDLPGFVDATLSPDVHTWTTDETRCSSVESQGPVELHTSIHARVIEQVPGFEAHAIPLEVTIVKQDPHEALDPRTYGPYEAKAAFETGYANRFEVRPDERVGPAGLDEDATFTGEVENLGNYATRFDLSVDAPGTIAVDGLDEAFVLGPGETQGWSLSATLDDEKPPKDMLSLTLIVETRADHASEAAGRTETVDLMMAFEDDQARQDVPGVSPLSMLLGVSLLAATRGGILRPLG